MTCSTLDHLALRLAPARPIIAPCPSPRKSSSPSDRGPFFCRQGLALAAPLRALGRSRCGKLVERGGIWRQQNKETGADDYTLTIRDHGFNANLSKAAN